MSPRYGGKPSAITRARRTFSFPNLAVDSDYQSPFASTKTLHVVMVDLSGEQRGSKLQAGGRSSWSSTPSVRLFGVSSSR
jgi:hypothetical protein